MINKTNDSEEVYVMKSLYDKDSKLTGWMQGKTYVWDLDFHYVAFIMNEYVFCVDGLHWIGGFRDHTFLDKEGYPVAHEQNHPPTSSMFMLSPPTPLCPPAPLPYKPWVPETLIPPPFPPLKGWSRLTFEGWLKQK